MRNLLLVANALVAVLFAAFFVYTFLGRGHIDGMAREFVTAKTEKFVRRAMEAAEEAIRADVVRVMLSKDQMAAVEREIAEFRAQPAAYIQWLTSAEAPPQQAVFSTKLSETILGWKKKIRTHYNKVLSRLIADLRIFSGTNVLAGCLAFGCAWRSTGKPSSRLMAVSVLLLVATGLGVYLYINSFSFFTILFDSYLGWWYPVLIGMLFLRMYLGGQGRRGEE
jgi:hypothetical protein